MENLHVYVIPVKYSEEQYVPEGWYSSAQRGSYSDQHIRVWFEGESTLNPEPGWFYIGKNEIKFDDLHVKW